jgi:ATP-dependent exoDNAse (exonuclease V) beta subunit
MDEIINNNKLTLFEEQRESIQKEMEESYRNDKDVVEVIDAIFGKQREDESNELPF